MRVIIVDDERLERLGLAKMIHNGIPEIEIIAEAPNGRMAIELARELKPDLIMMDIKMPGIDGVEAVREIKKMDKQIKFIMVSAFNTFEYAKEVMQQGVKEYILKPSKQEDVIAALKRVREEILEERKQYMESLQMKRNLSRALSVIESEWLSTLLMNHIEEMNVDEWSKLLGIEVRAGYMMIFSMQCQDHIQSNDEKRTIYSGVKSLLKTKLDENCIVGPMADNQIPVLVLMGSSHEIKRSNAITIARSVVRTLKERFHHTKWMVGLGQPFETIDGLMNSYHEAILALESKKWGTAHLYEKTNYLTEQTSIEKEKHLLESIKLGDHHRALQAFEIYMEANKDKNSHIYEELSILITRMLKEYGIHHEIKQKPIQEEQWIISLRQFVMKAVELVQAWRANHQKGYLQTAKEYIENNYEKNISLEEVADFVELSPFHFTKMFKEKFGVTFIDYLTDVRLEHAKRELIHTNKSLKEICYSVGYNDPNYFSRVFKKKTGLSPTIYRNQTT
ncbi:response regulator [Bacillus oleronius]|nr:response regulator [Heyndrickxia oleronia]